jgi:nucleoid-associated protein YgaU
VSGVAPERFQAPQWHFQPLTLVCPYSTLMVREHMPNPAPKIFKKSLLAVAVLTLSGCASAPKMDDVDLSPIGEGILVAGRVTAEVGIHAWDVSMYLLGFSDEVGDGAQSDQSNVSDNQFPLDEIDEAMLKDDALLPEDALSPVKIANATANYKIVFETPSANELTIFNETSETDPFLIQAEMQDSEIVDVDQADVLPLKNIKDEAIAQTAGDAVSNDQEYIHKVASNENLWDIAKATTGDATNWHVLADVNNLNQDAGIFVGQSLVIPSKMLKPSYLDAINNATNGTQLASNPTLINPQDENSSKKEIVIASNESNKPSSRLAIPAAPQISGTPVKLNPGETLWDFAKRTTGDATNWKAIARHNEYSDRQAVIVKTGQTILVPEDMMKSEATLASAKPVAKPAISEEARTEVLAAIEKVNQSAIAASSDILSEASSLSNAQLFGDETQPITIVEANFQADPSQKPIKIATDAVEVVKMASVSPELNQIMVSGTYYPKAIYNDADFSSSLLMRVSPGTSLKVSKALGNWFEVETDKGTGYVHQRDIK